MVRRCLASPKSFILVGFFVFFAGSCVFSIQRCGLPPRRVWKVHFGQYFFSAVLWCPQNTLDYSGFATFACNRCFLQHAENCVNTSVTASCLKIPVNTVFSYRWPKIFVNPAFLLPRHRKHLYLRRFLLQWSQIKT